MKPASDSLKQLFENPQMRERVRLLTPEQLLALVKRFPRDEQEAVSEILEELRTRTMRETAQEDFMAFVKEAWPTFIGGRHHARMAKAFEEVASGEVKRLIINMPPRHTKSEFASYLLPAWFLGKFPHKKVIQTSHTAELAVGFGRKVRNLVDSEAYARIFPMWGCKRTPQRQEGGTPTSVVTISPSVWAAQ